MENFKIGQSSLEVAQIIVRNFSKIIGIKLISHEVGINWRQLHKDPRDKIRNVSNALQHPKPIREVELSRKNFLDLKLTDLEQLPEDQVWSLTSKVVCQDGIDKHIPMMNFHPHGISLEDIVVAIKVICNKEKGVILQSGRFFHYYGNSLLSEGDWMKFMLDFLMPCVLVSPRYIGHRLSNKYCTLRLTTDSKYNKVIPRVIKLM